MNATAVLLIVALLTLVVEHQVHADFFYNRVIPKPEEISNLDLKCVPGRTIMKIQEKAPEINNEGSSSEDEENMFKDRRRKHMTAQTNDDYCKVCVCSVSGKDEYCSRRPARNVNECLRMATLMQTFKENIPFEHERSLSFRIRRVGNEVSGTNETHCIPFVSEYSDCSDANACTGCSKCTCTAEGKWTCEAVNYCPGTEEPDPSEDDEILDNAIQAIQYEFASKAKNEVKPTNNHPLVPGPSKFTDDVVLGYVVAIPRLKH